MIHHVTRVVNRASVDACVAFYEILGFRPVEVPMGIAGRAEWLEEGLAERVGPAGRLPAPSGGQQVHLMFGEDAHPEAGHLAVVCDDYHATVERLRGAGHEVEPHHEHWRSPRAYVHDPAGNLVELMAWAPGAPAPTDAASPSASV